jgi:hypothetical protein
VKRFYIQYCLATNSSAGPNIAELDIAGAEWLDRRAVAALLLEIARPIQKALR